MRKEKLKKVREIFSYFFRISWFTFGGGWSIVAQMQKDYVDRKKELTTEELLDIVSVGRSLPGTMIGNVAFLFGYRQAGALGGVLAVVGMVLPPMLILSVLTFCYTAFKDTVWVAKMLTGVRAAVVPIILAAALKLRDGAFPEKFCYFVCIGGCILNAVFGINCVLVILLGVGAGLLMGRSREAEA